MTTILIILIILNALCVILYTLRAINSKTKKEIRNNVIIAITWTATLTLNVLNYCL